MWSKICALILKLAGWTVDGDIPKEDKIIILGVPHTSVWDFVISYLYYHSKGGQVKCMVKKEFFFPPMGWIVRAMGGIPVDRQNSASLVRSVITEMENSKHFHLAIAPEGTRKPVKTWKSGFHLIAKTANIPVYLAYFDWGTKHVGAQIKIECTDDARADLKRVQELYEQMHLTGKHPENYRTH